MNERTGRTGFLTVLIALTGCAFAQEGLPLGGSNTLRSIAVIKIQPELQLKDQGYVLDAIREIELEGPAVVRRSDPKVASGVASIDTEMISLELVGFHPVWGDIEVRLSSDPRRRSTGNITGRSLAEGLDTFFDLFLEVTIKGQRTVNLHNEVPQRIEAKINAIPPFEVEYSARTGVPLLNADGTPGGFLFPVIYIPTTPSQGRIKRELILLQKRLEDLVRAHGLTPP